MLDWEMTEEYYGWWMEFALRSEPPQSTLMRSASRDNLLLRAYTFASLRFQVGVVNRRLGDRGRYRAKGNLLV